MVMGIIPFQKGGYMASVCWGTVDVIVQNLVLTILHFVSGVNRTSLLRQC